MAYKISEFGMLLEKSVAEKYDLADDEMPVLHQGKYYCMLVLDSNNDPMEGLYVASVDTGSMYTMPYYNNPGASVGLAIGSGVLAAEETVLSSSGK